MTGWTGVVSFFNFVYLSTSKKEKYLSILDEKYKNWHHPKRKKSEETAEAKSKEEEEM